MARMRQGCQSNSTLTGTQLLMKLMGATCFFASTMRLPRQHLAHAMTSSRAIVAKFADRYSCNGGRRRGCQNKRRAMTRVSRPRRKLMMKNRYSTRIKEMERMIFKTTCLSLRQRRRSWQPKTDSKASANLNFAPQRSIPTTISV